jgi:leucyl/phenylalanyl-tRNA--protein transferase
MLISGFRQISPVMMGSIDPESAIRAYRRGYFPMGASRSGDEYAWFSHLPRGILPLNALHISRSMQKTLRRDNFEISCDTDFEAVIDHCAVGRGNDDRQATWIAKPIRQLFLNFFQMGLAHTIECRQNGLLIGGLYGLHLGGAFFGESMFYRAPNASKAALVHLINHLNTQGFTLLDTQQTTPHTRTLGAVDVNEREYINLLNKALTQDVKWGQFLPRHSPGNGDLPP